MSSSLKEKAVSGIFFLGLKRVLVQVIFSLSNIILARLLFPQDFGTFAIVVFISSMLIVFTDLGLGASLVQKKSVLKDADLETALTVQFSLAILVAFANFILAGPIANFFSLGDLGRDLFRLYSIFFLFGPIKSTTGSVLERNLQYGKLITAEVGEVFVGAVVTVVCAFLGLGVFSFVYGSLAGHFTSTVFYFVFSQWRLRLGFSRERFLALAKFGVPYQTNAFLNIFSGPLVLLYLGKMVGSQNLGYFQFAAGLSTIPLLLPEIIQRIVYPLGARSQSDREFLKKIIQKSLLVISVSALPIVFISLAVVSEVVQILYTSRWTPALPALYIGLLQMGIVSFTGICGQFLFAIGEAKFMRNMSIILLLFTWTLGPVFIYLFNFVGMSLVNFILALVGIWIIIKLKKEVGFTIWQYFLPFLAGSIVSGVSAFIFLRFLPTNLISLILASGFSCIIYLSFIFIFAKRLLFESLNFLVRVFISK